MTYAPDDLLAVRSYLRGRTSLDAASVGIAGDPAHASTGGYHEGNNDLANAGRLATDYSKRESGRDRPGSDAASALDIGDFTADGKTLRQLTLFLVGRCQAGDPRCADIREIIYTADGSTVRRWDRLGIRSTGDSSHLYHTHLSFFRDSEGRRATSGNILGLLVEFFEGITTVTDPWAVVATSRRGPTSTGNALLSTYDEIGLDVKPALARLEAAAAADATRDAANTAAITALTSVIQSGGGSVDTAAILAGIADAVHTAVAPLEAEIADLRHRLAEAERAAGEASAATLEAGPTG